MGPLAWSTPKYDDAIFLAHSNVMKYVTITFIKKKKIYRDTQVIPSFTLLLITQALLSLFKLKRWG